MTKGENEAIERLKEDVKYADLRDTVDGDCTICFIEDIETALNLIQKQQEEIEEYEKTLDIFDEREYRKKYLKEERAKRKGLLYPDADEIYQRYYQQKAELEKKDRQLEEIRKENHDLKEKLQMFIPRRRVRRIYKMIGKILRTDIDPIMLEEELKGKGVETERDKI